MERLGNERLEAEIARIWDNVKASEAREVSVSSTASPAQQESSSSKRVPGRREHDMAVAKKTISRKWGNKNAAKLWPYVTSYSMVREMRTVANTGISFEKAIQALNRVVLDRLIKPHPGSRLTTAFSKADFVAVAKDPERGEVTAEEAQQQGYVFDSDGSVTGDPVESTKRALPMLTKELGTPVSTPERRVKSENHDGEMSTLSPVAGHKRRFSSTFGPAPYFIGNPQPAPETHNQVLHSHGIKSKCASEPSAQEYHSDGGAHEAMRGDFNPDYDEDARDLDMHINILSRMVAQSVDWRGVVMHC
ncbi:hypothetical protein SI65_05619 [Aspergillus cristatus]|uniref:Uncharacterized protein n=1 Tax=Aspergillus cristatus TaxID=573508 RepID=A0A1E3BDF3_ASPCR|nr:hypothetical protein SI65_05619 [Aspergillus cristatus]